MRPSYTSITEQMCEFLGERCCHLVAVEGGQDVVGVPLYVACLSLSPWAEPGGTREVSEDSLMDLTYLPHLLLRDTTWDDLIFFVLVARDRSIRGNSCLALTLGWLVIQYKTNCDILKLLQKV